jgi:NAD(P)-dependent dehydrogenase (short-subunit alcohol dehydrogenase family)
MTLKDRVAIVTGAGSGIGAASAQAMAAAGARVLVVDLNETGAKSTVAAIERERGT